MPTTTSGSDLRFELEPGPSAGFRVPCVGYAERGLVSAVMDGFTRLLRAGLAVLLIVFTAMRPGHSAELPAEVRIATYSFSKDGEVSIRGTPVVDRIIDEGWLESELGKRGIRLVWYPTPPGDTGATTNEAFATRRIDFANYGDLPSISLNAAGIRTQVIVPSGSGVDTYLLVRPDSVARSIVDLKGGRISIHRGRPWELSFLYLLDANGLSYDDFRIFNVNPPAGAAALAAGSVDAHFVNGGYLLEEKGIGKIIWSTRQQPVETKMRAELWGARAFTDRYPELTQLVATAYVRAQHWLAQPRNRDAVIEIGTRNGTPESVVRREYEDPQPDWASRWSPLFDDVVRQHYRLVSRYAADRKLVNREIPADELIAPQFVENALKQLELQDFWQPRRAAGNAVADVTPRR